MLGASVGFGIGLVRVRFRNLWYLGDTALFLVLAGEEISWGQRLLGIDTPEGFARINEQGETSLHNVTSVHGSIRAVGLPVILVICFAIPALHRWSPPARRQIVRWHHPVFPTWAIVAPILGILFMAVPPLTIGVDFPLDEVGELYIAAAMFIFGCSATDGRNPTSRSSTGPATPADRD